MKKETPFDYWEWPANYFITAKPFKQYIRKLKKQFIGLPLTTIYTMGSIFNNYENEELHKWDAEGCAQLDEPIVLDCAGQHLDICFYNTSQVKIGVDTLAMTEHSYQGYEWRDVSALFPHVIGQEITDIILFTNDKGFYDSVFWGDGNRPDGGDYFSSMLIIFENGFVLDLYGLAEYMWILQRPKYNYRLFPTDARLHFGRPAEDAKHHPYISFISFNSGMQSTPDELNISEGNWEMLHRAIRTIIKDYDMYEQTAVSIADWQRILSIWRHICEAKDSAWELYDNFYCWTEKIKDKSTDIVIAGL